MSAFAVRGILLFWALWLSVVSASNLVDALQAGGAIEPGWRFASGNFSLVAESLSIYAVPSAAAGVLFALVLLLELAASALFWRAALAPDPFAAQAQDQIFAPFWVAIGLFCAFLVCDELLLVYRRFPSLAPTHFAVLSALLLSAILIRVLDAGRRR